jgi:hypothetical protein
MSTDTTTKKPELRPLEVGVGAGAAVITAFASSYLGTAGTITGAALASVVGTVSTSVLRASAAHSAERLRDTTARLRETRTGSMPRPTDVRPVESGSDPDGPEGTPLLGAPDPERAAEGGRRPGRRQLVMLGAGTVIAFAVALVLITGIESAAGKPLAGLVGKQTGGGTTIGHATGTDGGSSTKTTPAPTPTATTTGTGTPTGTEDPSATASPTAEPTTSPTAVPSATTAAPTATVPAPTVAPTASPNPLTSESPQASPTP